MRRTELQLTKKDRQLIASFRARGVSGYVIPREFAAELRSTAWP